MDLFKKVTLTNTIKALLGAFLFLLPWRTVWIYKEQFLNGIKWEYGSLNFYTTEILLWAIIILFIFWFYKNSKFQIPNSKFILTKDRLFVLSCLIFIVYLLLSIVWSVDKTLALQSALHVMSAILLFFILLIGPLGWSGQLKWFVAGSVLPSILGIWQFLSQSSFSNKWLGLTSHPVWQAGTSIISSNEIGRWLRGYGSFSHPNVLGGYLVVAILFTLILIYKLKKRKYRLILLVVYLLQVTALFFTFSRSAWFGFLIVTLLHCYIVIKNKSVNQFFRKKITIYYLLFTCFLLSILTLVFLPLVQVRFGVGSINEVRSVAERVGGYDEAWQLFKQSPLLGVGVGNYTLAAYNLNPGLPGWEYQPVHNVFLLMLVELGIVGVLLFLILLIALITYHLSLFTAKKAKTLLTSVLLLAPIILLSFFDHYLFSSFVGVIISSIFLVYLSRVTPQPFHS